MLLRLTVSITHSGRDRSRPRTRARPRSPANVMGPDLTVDKLLQDRATVPQRRVVECAVRSGAASIAVIYPDPSCCDSAAGWRSGDHPFDLSVGQLLLAFASAMTASRAAAGVLGAARA